MPHQGIEQNQSNKAKEKWPERSVKFLCLFANHPNFSLFKIYQGRPFNIRD